MRQKMSAALTSPATREKMAAALNARWADPAMRAKMIAGMRAARAPRKRAGEVSNEVRVGPENDQNDESAY
jgi:hypothetical protein